MNLNFKILFFVLIAILWSSNSIAQVKHLAKESYQFEYELDLAKDTLILINQKDDARIRIAQDITFALKDNELIINYKLRSPIKKRYYEVSLDISMNDQRVYPKIGYLWGDLGVVGRSAPMAQGQKQIIWTDLIAQLPDSKGKLLLNFRVALWGAHDLPLNVDCAHPPKFEFPQKLPYYAGFVVGTGGLVTGIITRVQAQQHLDKHRAANTLSEQHAEYDSYRDEMKRAEALSYIGIGVIAIDAVLYVIRNRRHKKRVQIFEDNCTGESLSINPSWLPATGGSPQRVGFNLSYQF